MNLIIEQGNTSSKVAIYDEEGCVVTSFVFKEFNVCRIVPLFEEYDLNYGILSSVIEVDQELLSFLDEHLQKFIFLNEPVALPITIQYETPETLGQDRIAAAVGANYLQPGKNILVIDAGTAITYELMDHQGIYRGGNISPGMSTRFKALNHYTNKLPLVEEKEEIPLLGTTTETAIQAGVVNGIVYEMEGYIREFQEKYPDLLVFFNRWSFVLF